MLELYKNIRKYRLERQMSQSRLAELVGYSDKGMISRIENGKVDIPQSQIEKFAKALNVSPGNLMGWDNTLPSASAMDIAKAFEAADKETQEMVKRLLSYKTMLEKIMKDTEVDHGKD